MTMLHTPTRPPDTDPLTDELLTTPVWSDHLVQQSRMPVVPAALVSVGAGLGSFALADYLRIAGVATERIRTVGPIPEPWAGFKYLTGVSQIPEEERLRSDSGSVIDNIWGFPSFALREAWSARGLRSRLTPLWKVATEPVLAEYFTPRAGQVFDGVRRESERIDWRHMYEPGQARVVRRRQGGGYFVVVTTSRGRDVPARHAYRCRYVHLAVGYPGIKFLPDLQEYRQRTGDIRCVVNTYEPHDHVYEDLLRRPGTVVVRGSGIAALRVIQRLLEDREHGARTTVVHLFRNYVDAPEGPRRFRRDGGNGFRYQPFNFPKASWSGQLRETLIGLDEAGRADLTLQMSGTHTPRRASWEDLMDAGRAGGWYSARIGTVRNVEPSVDGRIVTNIDEPNGTVAKLVADYIIDATGVNGDVRSHRLLDDLLDNGGARTNAGGRLHVEPTFEVSGTASGRGRLYASGSMTLGGHFAPVDSFLGLQYAAQQITDDLASEGFVPRITPLRSMREWWRWMRNRPPRVVSPGVSVAADDPVGWSA